MDSKQTQMRFRTELEISRYNPESLKLDINKPIIGIGSCFADNITSKMKEHLWDSQNPSGALYNPLSISKILRIALRNEVDSAKEIENSIFNDGNFWHSFLGDSSFSGRTEEDVSARLSASLDTLRNYLERAEAIFITFGTARCYFSADKPDYIVANCHKLPQKNFIRRCLSVEEITSEWEILIERIKSFNANLNIIFTVSPIRHLKDGLSENTISKSTLQIAINQLCKKYEFCHYFPAYEIMIDDLRDYRFYNSDMVHPSQQAIDYIWEKFCECYISPKDMEILKTARSLAAGLQHKSILENGEEREERQAKIRMKLQKFLTEHPGLKLLE